MLIPSLLFHANQRVDIGGDSFRYHMKDKGCFSMPEHSKMGLSGDSFARFVYLFKIYF